jgi:hypothetical protein
LGTKKSADRKRFSLCESDEEKDQQLVINQYNTLFSIGHITASKVADRSSQWRYDVANRRLGPTELDSRQVIHPPTWAMTPRPGRTTTSSVNGIFDSGRTE